MVKVLPLFLGEFRKLPFKEYMIFLVLDLVRLIYICPLIVSQFDSFVVTLNNVVVNHPFDCVENFLFMMIVNFF